MGHYLLRRLLIALPSLLGISVVLFTVLALAPGDPITVDHGEVLDAGQPRPPVAGRGGEPLGLAHRHAVVGGAVHAELAWRPTDYRRLY